MISVIKLRSKMILNVRRKKLILTVDDKDAHQQS